MSKIERTPDEVYSAVYDYYADNRIEKWNFTKRLKAVTALLNGHETIGESVGWVWATELIELYAYEPPEYVRAIKKGVRDDFKGILALLDVKVSRNILIDLRSKPEE